MTMTAENVTARNSNCCEAITAPLQIVQELYSKRASSLSEVHPRDFGVEDYFKELVGDASTAASVRASLRLNFPASIALL